MTADVEEAAQHTVCSADDDDRLATGKLAGNIVAWGVKRVEPTRTLPGAPENRAELQFHDARVGVPDCGDGGRLRERRIRAIQIDDLPEGTLHVSARGPAPFE